MITIVRVIQLVNHGLMKPVISDYISVFQFLQDYYLYRKETEALFSYASWSKELGIKNKSYLRFMILGKRPISTRISEVLRDNLGFNANDKKIFEVLCLYSQSRSDNERKVLGKELVKLLKHTPQQEEIVGHHEMMMNPLAVMIRTLLTFKDLQKTAEELATILDVEGSEVEKALKTLLQAGLIESVGESYRSHQSHAKIPDGFNNLGLEEFYKKSFQTAAHSINLPVKSRRFRSWFVAVDEEKLLKLITESEKTIREKVLEEDSDIFEGKRLFQILFAAYPVSK